MQQYWRHGLHLLKKTATKKNQLSRTCPKRYSFTNKVKNRNQRRPWCTANSALIFFRQYPTKKIALRLLLSYSYPELCRGCHDMGLAAIQSGTGSFPRPHQSSLFFMKWFLLPEIKTRKEIHWMAYLMPTPIHGTGCRKTAKANNCVLFYFIDRRNKNDENPC